MAAHDFTRSIRFEHSGFDEQDEFYRKVLNAEDICRTDYDSGTGRELQRKDVDVLLTLDGRQVKVSEKRRDRDYDDLLVEVYSKFPGTAVWLDHSEADSLAYFVPGKAYWIEMRPLKAFYGNILRPALPDTVFSRLVAGYPYRNASCGISVCMGGKKVGLRAIQAYNCPEDGSGQWYTESVCVPFTVLEEYGVPVRKFVYDNHEYGIDRDK